MMRRSIRPVVFVVVMGLAGILSAQFGHPLKGSWSGDWGPDKDRRTRVLLNLEWDGKAISGAINPGPNEVAIKKAALDPSNWTVHLEAEAKDAAGKTVPYVIDGKMENIGAAARVITGTWTEGSKKGDLKLTRN